MGGPVLLSGVPLKSCKQNKPLKSAFKGDGQTFKEAVIHFILLRKFTQVGIFLVRDELNSKISIKCHILRNIQLRNISSATRKIQFGVCL